VPEKSLAKLKELSQFVDEIANLRHNPRLPWVGSAAFAHKGGAHVNAVQKLTSSYEHIDPARVGNARTVLMSDLAGRSNVLMKAEELGIKLSPDAPELKPILNRVKELENEGYEFEAAEGSLALLIKKILLHRELPFTIDSYEVSVKRSAGQAALCQASIKVSVKGGKTSMSTDRKQAPARGGKETKNSHEAKGTGDGPINALDSALRQALTEFYPELKTVRLTDYKVRILDGIAGTAAKTRVLIQSTDGKREWGTVGMSENIIEASLQALVDSMEFALLKK
jgi:2-isopropylmalate synthase